MKTRWQRLGRIRIVVALAMMGIPAWGQDADTPRSILLRRVGPVESFNKTEDAGVSPTLARRVSLELPSTYMVEGEPVQAVDLDHWSDIGLGDVEMPLRWDPAVMQFRVFPLQLVNETSDVQVWFTWNFLKAYAKLAADLRKSGSTLAVGVAAIVAADAVYPENWACLPAEVRDAAAIVTLLRLHAPVTRTEFHDACVRENLAERRRMVRAAVDAMSRTKDRVAAAGPVLANLDWLDSAPLTRGAGGGPVSVDDFLPQDSEALERVLERVHKEVANLTIRAWIVAAALPRLYGLPGSGPKEKDETARNWEKHFTRLLDAVQEELKIRDLEMNHLHPRGAVIVPQFQAGPDRELRLRSDPAVLAPLIVIAVQLARVPLRAASQRDDPNSFLAALRAQKTTSQVLALAGVVPSHEVRGGTGAGTAPRITSLTWSGLERLSLSHPKDVAYKESVHVDLIDDRPTGQGRALGLGADNRLIVLQADGRRTVRQASKVGPGVSVLGYVGIGQPAREDTFRVAADVHEAWFRVLDARVDTPRTVAVDLRLDDSKPFLFGEEHRILIALGESATWRKAGNLRPGYELWDQPSNKKVQPKERPTLKGLVPRNDAVRMVTLSLSWNEARGQATNVVVLPPGDVDGDNGDTLAHGLAVLAEARSADSGPVAPDQLVETVGPESRKVVAIRADRLSKSASQPSVLAGYFLQGKDDVWREIPWLSSHPARVLDRETIEVQQAHRLRLVNGESVVLGPGNWVLVRGTDQRHDVAVEKPISDLRVGDELVAGVHDRMLKTVRLVEIEPVRVPPGESSRFIQLRAENLPWAKVGPVLVSVEAQVREDDAAAEGLAVTTRLAMQRPDGEPPYVAITTLAGNDQGGGGWPAAAVDPRIPELLRVPLLAGVRPRPSTRTVIVETASVPPGETGSPRSFECAPGQLLLVRRQNVEGEGQATQKVLAVTAARSLRRGDELVVLGGAKGGTPPGRWSG